MSSFEKAKHLSTSTAWLLIIYLIIFILMNEWIISFRYRTVWKVFCPFQKAYKKQLMRLNHILHFICTISGTYKCIEETECGLFYFDFFFELFHVLLIFVLCLSCKLSVNFCLIFLVIVIIEHFIFTPFFCHLSVKSLNNQQEPLIFLLLKTKHSLPILSPPRTSNCSLVMMLIL